MRHHQNAHPSTMWRALPVLSKFHAVLVMVICASGFSTACGPGTIGTQTRKNTTPMKLRQSLPDLPETSLGASGQYVERVRRGSEAYKALEVNYNPDIVFKADEKYRDETRRMTKNCFKKLNRLAEDVKRTWGSKGVKLRVIDAFDLDDVKKRHGENSLHHEGRAVDLTTSDKDKSKYPILGRMAYEAGFNWVYYAGKGYIHASVKTDKDAEEQPVSCFPESASVRLEGGQTKTMKDLQIGDKVASMDSSGKIVYSKVLTFLDIKRNMSTAFVTIQTKSPAAQVTITEFHLIYQLNKQALRESAVFARDLKVGDFVYVRKNRSSFDRFTAGRVVAIKRRQGRGAYAPLTETGNIVVDDVLCSCYAVISDPRIAHWSFAPIRFSEWLFPGIASHNKAGMHWYAQILYKLYTSWNYVYEKVFDSS